MNEVVDDPMTGIVAVMERLGLENGSARDLVAGDKLLLIESIDVAGEIPSDPERLFRG